MDYQSFGTRIAADYDRGANQYRQHDEIEARSENHQRIGGNLRRICRSFSRPVRVLEMGCGTGRYFHWLDHTQLLVGTDISAEMLKQAKHPVRGHEVAAREIRLMQKNIYELNFEPGSFDFIYSLGVFGYGTVLTPELCVNLALWLTPGGRLYFDAIEQRDLGRNHRMKQSLKLAMVPLLPAGIKRRIAARETSAVPIITHTCAQIERFMSAAGFVDFAISSNTCHSPLWTGTHLECCARKGVGPESRAPASNASPAEFDLEAVGAGRSRAA